MTEAEAAAWVGALNSMTGFAWQHGFDHRERERFKALPGDYEIQLWLNGEWAVFHRKGTGAQQWSARTFQQALDAALEAYHRMRGNGDHP